MQPALPLLFERFQSMPIFRDNWAGTVNMGSSRLVTVSSLCSLEQTHHFTIRPETMQAFLNFIRCEYGGVQSILCQVYICYGEGHVTHSGQLFDA
ncbi:hypothetical protein PYCCODRAFT_204 [Trametes coccinea BRFM310]|uniref:Uncharacterized protein n=1 Tax=Trametes coccinea (strain BRFM310) TaxID=1353009 RepID=A0A1Y2J491_TRAC3|nr:hypothetical protein PYCCODRAFT_204 [Trametes coccinea BRFM310]